MKKWSVTTTRLLVATCIVGLVLTGCSSFKDAESHFLKGCELQQRKKHHLAVKEFKMAVKSDPKHAAAYNRLGVSLDAMGKYEKAISAYETALDIDPTLTNALNNLGYSHLLQDRPDLAVGYFEEAAALDGSNCKYRNNLGLAYAETGRYEAAMAAFKTCGNEAQAHMNMGRILLRNGLYKEANVHFARASVLQPSDTAIKNARKASISLAQIHQGSAKQKKNEEIQIVQHDEEGFYTIPSGAIQDLEIASADQKEVAEDRMYASRKATDNNSVYTLTVAQIESATVNEAARDGSDKKPLRPFSVLKQMESRKIEIVDTEQSSVNQGKENEIQVVWQDEDDYYTIPAGAIQGQKTTSVDQKEVAENRIYASKKAAHNPVYTLAVAQIEGATVNEATRDDSHKKPSQPFAVLKQMESRNLEDDDEPIYTLALSQIKSTALWDDSGKESMRSLAALKQMESGNPKTVYPIKPSFAEARIEISNGSGVKGMAKTVGEYLKANGITNYRLTNADHFNYEKTVVYYREGYFDHTSHVKGLLPGFSNADLLMAAHLKREPIRVVIGHDLVDSLNTPPGYDFNVDVSNGNGVNGMAKRLATYLSKKGFRVGHLTNADHFRYSRTIVFYRKGQSSSAKLIASALPENCDTRLVGLNSTGDHVQVTFGSDMVF